MFAVIYIISNKFSPVTVSTSKMFISIPIGKIVMDSHRQVILTIIVQNCICYGP